MPTCMETSYQSPTVHRQRRKMRALTNAFMVYVGRPRGKCASIEWGPRGTLLGSNVIRIIYKGEGNQSKSWKRGGGEEGHTCSPTWQKSSHPVTIGYGGFLSWAFAFPFFFPADDGTPMRELRLRRQACSPAAAAAANFLSAQMSTWGNTADIVAVWGHSQEHLEVVPGMDSGAMFKKTTIGR
jgi:hypothetical protein